MIKYKRIYPLRQNGRLAAIVTASGGNDFADISVKFKAKPSEDGLYLVFFNPKTYEYEMMPLKEKMCLNRSITNLTGCAVISKNGMLVDVLMAGAINRANINVSKLKSVIAMDSYSSCNNAKNPEQDGNAELMDYLKEMEGTIPDETAEQENSDAEPAIADKEEKLENEQRKVEKETVAVKEVVNSFEKVPTEPNALRYQKLTDPFKGRWNGLWWQVKYPNKDWHYIVGRIRLDGDNISVLGVPGDKNKKPASMEDCNMYAVAENGVGYWLIFQKS